MTRRPKRPAAPNAGVPRLRADASPLARVRVREAKLTQQEAANLVGMCLRRYQCVEADYRLLLPREADFIALRFGQRIGRSIDPYEEFAGYPGATATRQVDGAECGTPARGGLRVLSGGRAVERITAPKQR